MESQKAWGRKGEDGSRTEGTERRRSGKGVSQTAGIASEIFSTEIPSPDPPERSPFLILFFLMAGSQPTF